MWVDYLASSEAKYPTWFKYYVLKSVVKMGTYNKGKHEFSRRTKDTIVAFPNLNRDALTYSFDILSRYFLEKERFDDEQWKRLGKEGEDEMQEKKRLVSILDSANFSKIYAFTIEKTSLTSKESKEKIEGEWVKFDRGSNAVVFYESLQGYDTGWCTDGRSESREQLQSGDFYVYYTKDENGKNVVPRIAIRTWLGRVFEVRGIEENQNIEENMLDIARGKYLLLPGGDGYERRYNDMKLLTLINEKTWDDQELTIEELMFLYEIDKDIAGFGTKPDPRIRDIIFNKRDAKSDLSLLTGFTKEEISLSREEALNGDIKYHYGDLSFFGSIVLPKGSIFPESVYGSLKLNNLTSVDGLILPRLVKGDFNLSKLASSKGLVLPKVVGGDLSLSGLTSIDDLVLPEFVGGKVWLSALSENEKDILKQKYPNLEIV
jgi:hypothetical protein